MCPGGRRHDLLSHALKVIDAVLEALDVVVANARVERAPVARSSRQLAAASVLLELGPARVPQSLFDLTGFVAIPFGRSDLARLDFGCNRQGVDGYSTKVAVKVFYRNPELALDEYIAEMQRIAVQAQHVSGIQHDNLVNVRDFVALEQTRVMVLEWIDGLDLGKLLDPRLLGHLKERLEKSDWDRLNDVIMTKGDDHSRLRPGVAVDILHDCLGGLSALHKNGIAHCDLKPSNIMVKRTGTKKIIDIDSSCVVNEGQHLLRGTPYYMSPEQLRRKPLELYSDIATLGYVLIEMLTGRLLFRDCKTIDDLLQAKLSLPERLAEFLPAEIGEDTLLTGMVQKMVAVDPTDRFPNADEADLDPLGAISFTRKLVREDLATEYDRELAWLPSCSRCTAAPASCRARAFSSWWFAAAVGSGTRMAGTPHAKISAVVMAPARDTARSVTPRTLGTSSPRSMGSRSRNTWGGQSAKCFRIWQRESSRSSGT